MPPRRSRILVATLPLALLAGGTHLFAQPFAAVEDRRRAVDDWLVEHVGEEDGGRMVRMTREGEDYSVEYRVSFWRGNSGPVRGGSVIRLNGMCGGFESPPNPAAELPAAAIRAELAGHLAQCGVSDEAGAATLEGFERAYALVTAWAGDAAAATAAEAGAVADYGMDMGLDANMTDMNYGIEPESDPGMDLNATDAGGPD